MNLYNSVRYLFPQAIPFREFSIRDDSDGKGPYIDPAAWKIDAPIPTDEELRAAWEAFQAEEANKPPVKTLEDQLAEARTIQSQLSQELAVQKDINTANSQNFMDLVDYLTAKGVLE